jgi:hypothetical protein
MIVEIARAITEGLARAFPWAVRHFYTECRMRTMLKVEPRSDNGIVLNVHSVLPELSIWLQITNHSPFFITVDRVIADVWFGQPTCYVSLLVPVRIPPHTTVSDIGCKSILAPNQLEQAEKTIASASESGHYFYLYLTLVCRSAVRDFITQVPQIQRSGPSLASIRR